MSFRINNKTIGPEHPVFIIAEMSANHNQKFDDAVRIIHAARECGADAVKLQTYTPWEWQPKLKKIADETFKSSY